MCSCRSVPASPIPAVTAPSARETALGVGMFRALLFTPFYMGQQPGTNHLNPSAPHFSYLSLSPFFHYP